VTTPTEAIAAYRQYQASQADGTADPPAAVGRPTPDPAHAAALEHAAKLLTPAYRQAEQQRAAAVEAERQAALPPPPPPRETLRDAHRERTAAEDEVERIRSARDRAREHLVEVTAERDAAKQALAALEAADTARLLDELASGSAGRVDPVAAETRAALANAEHQFAIATRAVDKLAADFKAADQRLAAAGRATEAAVIGMLLAEAARQAVEILQAVEELDDKRRALDALAVEVSNRQRRGDGRGHAWAPSIREALAPGLRAPARMPSQFATPEGAAMIERYSAIARALLADPEAEIT
jgi:hypothetical protein